MPDPQVFATVSWCAADVLELRPDLTVEEADEFLTANEHNIRDRMTERGWEAIDTLLGMDDTLPEAP